MNTFELESHAFRCATRWCIVRMCLPLNTAQTEPRPIWRCSRLGKLEAVVQKKTDSMCTDVRTLIFAKDLNETYFSRRVRNEGVQQTNDAS